MRAFKAVAAVAAIIGTAWACGSGDDASNSTDGGAGDDATSADGGGGSDGGGPAIAPPSSVTYLDFDPAAGGVDGIIYVGHASDESQLSGYSIFYGKSPTEKLQNTPITTFPKSVPANAGFMLTVNPIPAGATHLLAYGETADGGESAPVATKLDRVPVYVDLHADVGMVGHAQVLVDSADAALLVLYSGTDDQPHVVRCTLDGNSCASHIIPIIGAAQYDSPGMAIDSVNKKLLIAYPSSIGLALARCELDATGCHAIDISTGKTVSSVQLLSMVLDIVEGRLFVAASDNANQQKPDLFDCDLDVGADSGVALRPDGGAACRVLDISGGGPASSAVSLSEIVRDVLHDKLLVASTEGTNDTTSLFQCNFDGTGCAYLPIGADAGPSSGFTEALLYDVSDDSISIAIDDQTIPGSPQAAFIHCNGTVTGCTRGILDGGEGYLVSGRGAVALDDSTTKVLVATQDDTQAHPFVFRCARNGGACARYDFSSGRDGGPIGTHSVIAADPSSSIFVVSSDQSAVPPRVALYMLQ